FSIILPYLIVDLKLCNRTLERELNRKVSGKEIQPTLERIEQKMVQNQHQETPEFKAIQQKLESLQPPTPPIPKTPKLPGL
ncbi:TPA: hypothetical protein ACIZDY_002809, partial [Enterococcus faecalis]